MDWYVDGEKRQPFIFDRPLVPEDLVDREAELSTLLERLARGTNTRLTSPRDFGKTTLLRRALVDAERRGMAALYVDVDGVRTRAELAARIDAAYRSLSGPLRRAYGALRRRGGHVSAAGFGVGLGGDSRSESAVERELRDLLDLPVTFHHRHGTRVAVVFDEFQAILDAGQGIDGAVRSVIQHHADAACYVFSGSHPGMMTALFADRRRPFYGQAAPLELGPLPNDALAEHIAARFEATGREVGDAIEWLLDLAAGHPQRVMLLAHLLWSHTPDGNESDDEAWARALDDVWAYVREPFQTQWRTLTAVERGVVEAVASASAGLGARSTRERFGLPSGSAAPDAAARLERSGVLVAAAGAPTGHRLVDPLFAHYVAAGRRWPFLLD